MNLAEKCKDSFDDETRRKGSTYFKAGMVIRFKNADEAISASVRGGESKPYEVDLDLTDSDAETIIGRCTCPHYGNGYLCKHIWAVILANDVHPDAVDSLQPFVEVLHELDQRSTDEDEEHYEDQDPAGYSPEYGSLLSRFPLDTKTPSKAKRPATWRDHFQDIRRSQSRQAPTVPGSVPTLRRELIYVLNVSASHGRDMVAIDLFQREARRNGQWNKPKRHHVRPDAIGELPEEDLPLVTALLGNEPEEFNDSGRAFLANSAPTYCYRGYNRSWIRPAMYEWILPKLAATQRLVWLLESTWPVSEAKPVVWENGPPWTCRLRLETDDAPKCWRVRGELQRGEESVSLKSAVMVLTSGLVLFEDRLCLAKFEQHAAWIPPLQRGVPIEVPFKDREELIKRICDLPEAPHLELPPDLGAKLESTPARPIVSFSSPAAHRDDELQVNVSFQYGPARFDLSDERSAAFDDESQQLVVRDFAQERDFCARLPALGFKLSTTQFLRDRADFFLSARKLSEVVRKLDAEGWLVQTQGIKIRRPGEFNLKVTSSLDWFELRGTIDFDGVSASLPALLAAVRNQEQFVRLDDGTHGMLPEEWLQRYGYLAELADAEGDALRFKSSQGMLLDALLAEQYNVELDERFSAFRDKLRTFSGVEACVPDESFQGSLRHYQQEGLGWLHFLRDFGFGGCLADDMGLGKTVQVLALLENRRLRVMEDGQARRPSIVVVPKSLIFNWVEEAARFTPQLRILNFTGLERGERHADEEYDVLITTYGTLRRDIMKLRNVTFDYAILDEAQAIKNAGSQAAKSCRLIKADHRLAMSGTPVENHLGELWSLFEFLNPGMLGRSSNFASIAKSATASDRESLQLLARAVRPFLLRRTKEQVLKELPEKLEQTLSCEFSPAERKAYNELRDFYRNQLTQSVKKVGLAKSKIHVLEALLRLRQAACHPALLDKSKIGQTSAKLEALLDQIREVLDEGHKALVFSQFTSLLAIVRHHLDLSGTVYEYLDGQTRNRGDRVKRFQQDPDCRLFLISLKAGGHGLNLTAADYVFILDPWWNPAVEAQAVDRAHRIGQTRPVFAYRLIARGTVEDKILELQKSKKDLADAIVSANDSLIRSLTSDDLELLLS